MDILFNQVVQDIELIELGDNTYDIAVITTPADTLVQRLFLRFKTYKKDLMWNTAYGIDYLNDVFGIKKSRLIVDAILREEIKKEPMVKEIISFESELVSYNYACKFRVSLVKEDVVLTYYILTNENGFDITNENGDVLTLKF